MTKIKLEHIDNLRRGKKSGAKIGSRGTPHHLYQYEEPKYERALKYRFLEITSKDRVNLRNLWQKVCLAKGWKNYVLVKDMEKATAWITLDDRKIEGGTIQEMKKMVRELISKTETQS